MGTRSNWGPVGPPSPPGYKKAFLAATYQASIFPMTSVPIFSMTETY